MLKYFANLLIVIFLFIMQAGFVSGLPAGLNAANLSLVSLLFFLVFDDMPMLIFWLISFGVLGESVSYLPFGAIIFSLSATVVAAHFLLISWLTNRSLYSLLILVSLATIFNNFMLLIFNYFNQLFTGESFMRNASLMTWERLGVEILANGFLMIGAFYLVNFINPSLKPFLLLRRR